MKQLTGKRIMAILIGVIMLASILEVALLRTTPQDNAPLQLPNVLNRTLTSQEKIDVLRSGRVLIEYLHNESCGTPCAEKESVYLGFVTSANFKDLAVVSYGVSQNETADWMINLDGTQIDLGKINTTAGMQKLFCDKAIIKPNICLLEEV